MVKLAYQLTLKRLHIGPISFLGSLMARISDEETVVKMTAAALVTSKLHRRATEGVVDILSLAPVVIEHIHIEGLGPFSNFHADLPKPKNAQFLAVYCS